MPKLVKNLRKVIFYISPITFLASINFLVFRNYWLGTAIPPWDFIGGGMVEQYGFYEYGSFFNPPSWYPNAWFGIPEYQMLQDGGWFLPTLFVAEFLNWFPENAARLQAALIFIGSVGFYQLSKQFVNSRNIALLGAVMYSFNPAFFSNAQHYGIVRSSVLLPWLIYLIMPRIILKKWWAIPLASLTFFQLITGSYPGNLVSSIYTCVIIFIYLWFSEFEKYAYFIRVFIVFLGGMMLGLIRYLPTLNDLNSFPQNVSNYSTLGSWNFSTFIYPFVRDNLIGDPSMRSLYIGPLFLSTLPFLFFVFRKDKQVIFWSLIVIFCVTMMTSNQLTDLIRNILPFTNVSRFGMTDWRTTFYIGIIFITLLTLEKFIKFTTRTFFISLGIYMLILFAVWLIGTELEYAKSDISFSLKVMAITHISTLIYLFASTTENLKSLRSIFLISAIILQTILYINYYNQNKLTWESKEIDQNIYGQSFGSISRVIEYPLSSRPSRILLTPPPFDEWQYRTDYRYNKFWLTGEFGALGYHNVKDNFAYKSLEIRLQKENDEVVNFLLDKGTALTLTENSNYEDGIQSCLDDSSLCQPISGVKVDQKEFNRESEIFAIVANRDFIFIQNEMYSPIWKAELCDTNKCRTIESFSVLDSLRAWKIPKGDFEFRSEAKTLFNFQRWFIFWTGLILITIATVFFNRKLVRDGQSSI
jgi:hypothetical protein